MLIENLQKSVKQLKQLDKLEWAVQDAERKEKNDSDYSTVVTDFWVSIGKLSYASKELMFILSEETIQLASDAIDKLNGVISSGVVDGEELVTVKQYINRKVNPGLVKEWKSFHQQKTSGVAVKMETIGSLVPDRDKIKNIRTNIYNASDWNGLSLKDDGRRTRLELFKEGIDEVDKIEEGLNLRDEIKDFVLSVTRGKARVTDLTQTIIEWIKKENLEEKFVIGFKNL